MIMNEKDHAIDASESLDLTLVSLFHANSISDKERFSALIRKLKECAEDLEKLI